MNFTEYQKAALRTASAGKGPDTELCVRALGLVGETVELIQALARDEDPTEEAGDVLWYVATLAAALGVKEADIYDAIDKCREGNASGELVISVGALAELVKKQVGHGKTPSPEKLTDLLAQVIYSLAELIYPVDLEAVWDANVAKLKARYPEGFDTKIAAAKPDSDEVAP